MMTLCYLGFAFINVVIATLIFIEYPIVDPDGKTSPHTLFAAPLLVTIIFASTSYYGTLGAVAGLLGMWINVKFIKQTKKGTK